MPVSDFKRGRFGGRMRSEPIHVVVCERDIDDPLMANGAIVCEQYTNDAPESVLERAKMLADGGKYGRVWIAKLTDLFEISTMVTADTPLVIDDRHEAGCLYRYGAAPDNADGHCKCPGVNPG